MSSFLACSAWTWSVIPIVPASLHTILHIAFHTTLQGHIVCMSSMAGITGTPNLVPYCASKFALRGMMEALFLELRQDRPESKVGAAYVMSCHP